MFSKLIYVELKTGFSDDGPAWIGRGIYNRTRKTLYFDGKAFSVGQGIRGNHFEGTKEYWISGIKKNRQDRYPWGKGKISIDKDVIAEYMQLTGMTELPKSKYEIVELNKAIPASFHNEMNKKL